MGPSQITGGPGWMDTQLYAVRAKAASAVDPAQIREMLQNLLADRFQLQLRHEMKDVPALALVVAKKPREGYLTAVDGSDCKPTARPTTPAAN